MIKITYNGYQVETDDVEQARWLMKEFNLAGRKTVSTYGIRPIELPAKKRRKQKVSHSIWGEQEILEIFRLLDAGVPSKEISKNVYLRDRHNKRGIDQMVYKVQQRKTGVRQVSKKVGRLIDDYHRQHGTRLNVDHE